MERSKSSSSRRFLYNVLGALAFYGGFILVFALLVRWYTKHGQVIEVPDVKGKSLEEGISLLKSAQLEYMISDSVYDESKPALTIMDQNPQAATGVKESRKIYLTVVSRVAPQIQVPDLKDVSLKQASMILNSYGLKVGKLIYRPDLAKDVVIDQLLNGKPLKVGTSVKKGSTIDLVLGDGLGQTSVEVPNLIGLTLREALFVLDGSSLNLGAVVKDGSVQSDSMDAVVYKQIPNPLESAGALMNLGEGVDVFITSPVDYQPETEED